MNHEWLNKFIEFVEGAEGVRVRSYVGRGMYGKECVGITADSIGDVVRVVLSFMEDITCSLVDDALDTEDNESELREIARRKGELTDILYSLSNMSTDSMGCGVVVYWRQLHWPKTTKENET